MFSVEKAIKHENLSRFLNSFSTKRIKNNGSQSKKRNLRKELESHILNICSGLSQHLKPIISKGHSSKPFCYFFSFSWFQRPILVLWSCCIYLFSFPEHCATFVRSGFLILRLENFFETLGVASWDRFSVFC